MPTSSVASTTTREDEPRKDGKPKSIDASDKSKRINDETTADERLWKTSFENTPRTDRTSRGRLKFQPLDNAITENAKSKSPSNSKLPVNETATAFSDATRAMATTTASVTQVSVENKKHAENSTTNSSGRSGKSSNFRVGGDGYVFEKTFDLDAITESNRENGEEFAYEPLESTHVVGGGRESDNNIDRIRNYNDNASNVRVANIVKKPQGFTLTTETSLVESGLYRRPSTSSSVVSSHSIANNIAPKKRITNSVVSDSAPVISLTHTGPSGSSTENNPTSISKNEIVRKPSVKPMFSSRRRITPEVGKNENSLPTTSAVWALAALKTPTNFKVQKRPSGGVEMVRKPITDYKVPVLPQTTIKPFVSWSTRLQKTTTEDALGIRSFSSLRSFYTFSRTRIIIMLIFFFSDTTTTFKTSLEVDAETFSPIALQGPKLMNTSNVREPAVVSTTTQNPVKILNDTKSQRWITASKTDVLPENVTSVSPLTTVESTTKKDLSEVELVSNVNKNRFDDVTLNGTNFGRFNYTTDAVPSATPNNGLQSLVVNGEPAEPEKENESDTSPKPASNLIKDTFLNNSSNAVVKTNEQKDVIMLAISNASTTTTTEMSSTPNLNVNNSLVLDSVPFNGNLTTANNPTYLASPVVENAESNVIFDQTSDKKNHIDVNSIEKTEIANPFPRNVTEKKQGTSSLDEDTVVAISNSNNNSVITDENQSSHSDTVVIPIYNDDSGENHSNSKPFMNVTEVTG